MSRKSTMSAEEFVAAWQAADSIQELSEKTGIKGIGLSSRAVRYRKLGIELKKHKALGGGAKLDVEKLNALAHSAITEVQA